MPPRPDDLDIERPGALVAYLHATGRIPAAEAPRVVTLTGGVSNRTVLVTRDGNDSWVVKQALPRLRVAVDWFSPPERIHREALGLRWLAALTPPGAVVPFVFEDHGLHLLGMGAVAQPHVNWKPMLLAGHLEDDHVDQFARLLGTLHRKAWERRAEIEPLFRDRGFFESLRLEPYYAYTAEQVPAAHLFLHRLLADLRSHRHTLVHGDYSPKNVLVHHGRLVLLDHEVIHWGDPSFDLGFGLTHLLSKAHHLPRLRTAFAGATAHFWATYGGEIGDLPWRTGLEARAVRATLGCLLARVAGRSPLEYLDPGERLRQGAATLALMEDPPATVAALADRFVQEIDERADG